MPSNPMNIMDVADYVQKQGDLGKQQGLQTRFNALAGQAYTAPAGDARTALVGQAVATDPTMGVQLGNVLASRDATQATAEKNHLEKIGGAARYMMQAVQTKNPAAIEGAYQAVRPYLAQLGAQAGKVPPEHYDPTMDAGIQQIIAQTGGLPDQQGVVINGSLINKANGQVMAKVPYPTQYQNAIPNGQGTAAGFVNPNDMTITPARVAGQPGQPQNVPQQPQPAQQPAADPMEAIIARGNQMVQSGMPSDQVEAWMQQQAQGAGLNPQPAGAQPVGQQSPQDMPRAAGQPASSLPSAPPAQFGVGTPKDTGEIATLKTLQSDPKLMKTWQLMHPASGGGTGNAPSGYRYNADKTALEPIPGGPADSSGSGQGLSTDAIDNAAWTFIGSGKLPAVGRGKEGVAQRTAVMNKSAEIAKAAGIPASELQTVPGRNRALQSSLTNLQKISDVMEKSENAFQNNTQVAMDLSSKLSRSGSPALNSWILGAKAQMGDPDVQALDAAITTMSVDYARIMSGATGAGGTPISTAEEAKSLIRKELSHQSLAAVVDVLNKDIAGQQAAVHGQRGKILGAMQHMHDESSPTTPGLNPPAPASSQSQAPQQPATGGWSAVEVQ